MFLLDPLIIAHRGASGLAPENSLAAFQIAVDEGADGIELDVHLSKDGEVVVIHDETIDRTSNGTGYVHEMTVDELKAYDIGSWFDPKFSSERIATLQEVIDVLPDSIFLNVEIKNSPIVYEGIESKLVDVLRRNNRLDSTVVSSFDHESLYRVKKLAPELKIGLLYKLNYLDTLEYVNLFKEKGTEVYSLHPSRQIIINRDIEEVKQAGLQIYPYTVNDEGVAQTLTKQGATGLITNYPKAIKEAVHRV